jgi:hypothetical protein
MSPKTLCITLTFASTFLLLNSAFAQKATLQAEVTGVDGRPSRAAQIQIERQDKKMAPLIVAADKRGHLAATSLDAGTYKVTATVEGGIKSSQTVKVRASKPSVVAFNMSKTSAVTGKGKKKYVWVPSETGTHLGGRWVEVDEASTADSPTARNVDTLSGNSLERAQRLSTGQAPKAAGGQ